MATVMELGERFVAAIEGIGKGIGQLCETNERLAKEVKRRADIMAKKYHYEEGEEKEPASDEAGAVGGQKPELAAGNTVTPSAAGPITPPPPAEEPDRAKIIEELKALGYAFPGKTRTTTMVEALAALKKDPVAGAKALEKFAATPPPPASTPPPATPPATGAAPDPFATAAPVTKPVTIEDARKALEEMMTRLQAAGKTKPESVELAKGVLASLGAKLLLEVKPEQYAALIELAKK